MAQRPDIVLSGIRPRPRTVDRDAPFRRQLLEQQVGLGEQSLAAGQRTADLADQKQMLIGAQRGINSFEAGDMGGVEQAIIETTPQQEQAQELAEFRANPAQYISRAKAEISAFRSQQAGGGRTAGQREFASQTAGLSAEDVEKARRIDLGLDPRATGAAAKIVDIGGVPHIFDPVEKKMVPVEIGGKKVDTSQVAKSKGIIKATEDAAKAAIKLSTGFFNKIEPIRQNLINIDDAIRLIDDGAATGPIISRLPSIRRASVELDTLQKKLGLDVIASTTFGALSEGEREFALSTALPSNLKGPDLKRWLQRKKIVQEKLINQLSDAATFLGTPGNTIADFIELQKLQDLEAQDPQQQGTAQQPASQQEIQQQPAAQPQQVPDVQTILGVEVRRIK